MSAHHGRPLTAFAVPGRPAADGDRSPDRTSQNRERSERPALHLPPSGCTARPILLRPPPPARALGRPLAALLTVSSTNCGTRSERSEGPTVAMQSRMHRACLKCREPQTKDRERIAVDESGPRVGPSLRSGFWAVRCSFSRTVSQRNVCCARGSGPYGARSHGPSASATFVALGALGRTVLVLTDRQPAPRLLRSGLWAIRRSFSRTVSQRNVCCARGSGPYGARSHGPSASTTFDPEPRAQRGADCGYAVADAPSPSHFPLAPDNGFGRGDSLTIRVRESAPRCARGSGPYGARSHGPSASAPFAALGALGRTVLVTDRQPAPRITRAQPRRPITLPTSRRP